MVENAALLIAKSVIRVEADDIVLNISALPASKDKNNDNMDIDIPVFFFFFFSYFF